MPTFDLPFSRKFAEVAEGLVEKGIADLESRRVTAYISRVSMELSLKALLESAGVPVADIRKHNHDLRSLLKEVGKCEIEVEISPGSKVWVSASRLRAKEISFLGQTVTLGAIIEAEEFGASKYPNEIRYGGAPSDFPPEILAAGASILGRWVEQYMGVARRMAV